MRDILKLARIQIGIIVLFFVFKMIRSSVLNNTSVDFIKLIFLSLPNLFEGIIGVLTLTYILLWANNYFSKNIKENNLYIASLFIAAVYVISQEFKLHNIGGNNIYDINDVIFSIIGLLLGYIVVFLIQPKVEQ